MHFYTLHCASLFGSPYSFFFLPFLDHMTFPSRKCGCKKKTGGNFLDNSAAPWKFSKWTERSKKQMVLSLHSLYIKWSKIFFKSVYFSYINSTELNQFDQRWSCTRFKTNSTQLGLCLHLVLYRESCSVKEECKNYCD